MTAATNDGERPLGLAFIGCGGVTRLHTRFLRRDRGLRRWYASREPARAAEFSRQLAGAGAFGSYDHAFASSDVDAVVIATPPDSHLELTLRALGAGKHVVVEKPPFLRVEDFDTVRRAREDAGRRVMVAENYYYKPVAIALRESIAAGDIGEVRLVTVNALKEQRATSWRADAARSGGGAMFEGGIHWVDFMANLGLPVASVHGFRAGRMRSAGDLDTTMVVVFRYATGAVGTLYYSWEIGSPLKGLRLSAVYGTEGTITFESNGILVAVRGRRRRLRMPGLDVAGYAGMWRDFLPALRANSEPRYDFELARRDLALTAAVYDSLEPPVAAPSGQAGREGIAMPNRFLP
ncbi:MAG TPA: Gfo/Idh/MocA family oxidoreductase [Gemmatimonadaceae bacterium]|nr:Gfo/Idh/MocA family oxidoreductase [Gemmatimonadaceae bacterium]